MEELVAQMKHSYWFIVTRNVTSLRMQKFTHNNKSPAYILLVLSGGIGGCLTKFMQIPRCIFFFKMNDICHIFICRIIIDVIFSLRYHLYSLLIAWAQLRLDFTTARLMAWKSDGDSHNVEHNGSTNATQSSFKIGVIHCSYDQSCKRGKRVHRSTFLTQLCKVAPITCRASDKWSKWKVEQMNNRKVLSATRIHMGWYSV